jgi:hypothetical protein
MLWNEEDREGDILNWHCNCSSAPLVAGSYVLGKCLKRCDFGVLLYKTAVAVREMEQNTGAVDPI